MASRYAAAHARREQRRRQVADRDYLPLAETPAYDNAALDGRAVERGRLQVGRTAAPAIAARLPVIDYSYLRGDLIRTAVLAIVLFGSMIILSFIIH
jgi:hypothetical protein